jgi:pectate lyase
MRQYLPLVWILGVVAACSGGSDSGDPTGTPTPTPTAGSGNASGAGSSAAGSQTTAGGSVGVGGGAGGAPASAGSVASGGGGSPSNTAGSGTTQAGTSAGGVAGTAAGGAAGAGGGPVKKPTPDFKFPTPVGADQKLSSTKEVTDFDGKMGRFIGTGDLGGTGQGEGQDPLFLVKAGGSLKNVILGSPAADGVHCEGSCTIENVWWEDVGEDAITLEGSSSSNVYRITGGGARKATDKVIQHNGGGTLYVKNFLVEDFGKLYRSCGNCPKQYQRRSEFDTIVANGSKSVLAGVNQNYKDSAKFSNIFADITMKICERYDGNDTGAEPNSLGSGADGTYCIYSTSDITWH